MNKIYIFERVLNEAVLEFTIVDTEAEAIYSVIGDIEALQSALFETYRLRQDRSCNGKWISCRANCRSWLQC